MKLLYNIQKELREKFDKGFKKPLVESHNEEYARSKMLNELVEMGEKFAAKPQHKSNPSSENLFAPVEQLESKIQEKDKIIEILKYESIELKNQVSIVEQLKNKLKELENSRWVALSTKKVYEDKIKSIIDETTDNKQLQGEIRDKDKIIEGLTIGLTKLKNQISIAEKEKSTILEGLKKSKWLENKVASVAKKLYEDKVKSIINENVDSKIIPVLTTVARRKQGNQQLTLAGWLKIPENRYVFQVNEDIAKKIFEDTNALIAMKNETQVSGGAVSNSSLTFTGNTSGDGTSDYVSTAFDPDAYALYNGFTVSYWVRPDEIGSTMFALGRKPSNYERFQFGINNATNFFVGVGRTRSRNTAHGMEVGTWYHWAVTYAGNDNGRYVKVYRDGELLQDTTARWDSTGATGGEPVYFGGYSIDDGSEGDRYTAGWACGLDEVAIFDEVKDVSTLYNSGTPSELSSESGLVGYWRFENGTGTVATDLSGNGNHGTLTTYDTGLPAWSTDTP